ncbi:MAG: hypothetical protein AB1540_17710, partial [Bdellovibrionota bacterium]
MRLSDHYDVICAGGGLSSYLCAALLAKSGKKLLIVDDKEHARERICSDGSIFDPDFFPVSGLGASAALGRSLRELGLFDEGQDFESSDAVTQVLTPDYRVVFWHDTEATSREIARELPRAGLPSLDFFSRIYKAPTSRPSFVENAITPGQTSSREVSRWKGFWGQYYKAIGHRKPVALYS